MTENVILVDENDVELGVAEKMEAHLTGALHRAVSVFIFNGNGELLLQRRAQGKYHSPGKWSNTCCTHPRLGELTLDAARRRLKEEMGIDSELTSVGTILYRADFENGLVEHELDHLFFGFNDHTPSINQEEVDSYRYIDLDELKIETTTYPERFTPWLNLCLRQIDLKAKSNESDN